MPLDARLYNALNVDIKASSDEIKKAYHKAAVRYHPDRQGGEANEAKFKEVQAAYEILHDPAKRKLYDRYGERGLRLLSQGGEHAADIAMLDVNLIACLLCPAWTLVVLSLTFLTLKVDGHIDWDWSSVFIPLWVIDGFLGCFALSIVGGAAFGVSDEENKWGFRCAMLSGGVQLVCFVAWTALLSRRLDGKDDRPWSEIFVPVYIIVGIMVATKLSQLRYAFYETACAGIGKEPSKAGFVHHLFWTVFNLVRMPVAVALLVAKLSDDLDASWLVVGIPYYVQYGLLMVEIVVSACLAGIRSECPAMLLQMLLLTFNFSSFALVLAKAAGADYSLAVAFIPVWITVVLACCMLLATPFLLGAALEEELPETSVPFAQAEHAPDPMMEHAANTTASESSPSALELQEKPSTEMPQDPSQEAPITTFHNLDEID
ncbi:Chaperone protein DnaJ [Diplonema papillatum]|nr:Chaperone protein DnaJ [Diplonema papillatum]